MNTGSARGLKMGKGKLSRREREKLRHRRLISDAALELFAERGYHNVTMHEIADSAEFAIGTLYNFFESKEAIYEAIMLETAHEVVGELIETISSTAEPLVALRSYIMASARLFSDALTVVRLFMSANEGFAGPQFRRIQAKIRRRVDDLESRVTALMAEGVRQGVFKEADPEFLAICLMSLCKGYFERRLFERGEELAEADVDDLLEFFMKGALSVRAEPSE